MCIFIKKRRKIFSVSCLLPQKILFLSLIPFRSSMWNINVCAFRFLRLINYWFFLSALTPLARCFFFRNIFQTPPHTQQTCSSTVSFFMNKFSLFLVLSFFHSVCTALTFLLCAHTSAERKVIEIINFFLHF